MTRMLRDKPPGHGLREEEEGESYLRGRWPAGGGEWSSYRGQAEVRWWLVVLRGQERYSKSVTFSLLSSHRTTARPVLPPCVMRGEGNKKTFCCNPAPATPFSSDCSLEDWGRVFSTNCFIHQTFLSLLYSELCLPNWANLNICQAQYCFLPEYDTLSLFTGSTLDWIGRG